MTTATVLGHRGSPDQAGGVGENTLEAFSRSRRLGADGVELDVRMTADGAVAVHHDPVIPGAGAVAALATADLPAHVPLLSVVLDAGADLFLNIELKNLPGEPGFDPDERLAGCVVALLEDAGRTVDVVISSFWPASLEAVHRRCPELPVGLLVPGWFDPSQAVDAARRLGCAAVHPFVGLVTAGLVDDAHAAGLSVAAWTVNDDPDLEAVLGAGVDTVITDDVVQALVTCDRVRARSS
ncbi:MAG: glycerophosphodiester phosphodiesterase [Acidimicrobiales bacterium]